MIPSNSNSDFEALLHYLKSNHDCDLRGYKRSTLIRRFNHRLANLGVQSYQHYLQHLQTHPEEVQALLDDVFINVTCFFRDRAIWNYLEAEIIPKILAGKQPDEPIRIWSAGCAYGQEIYSALMLFAEAIGIESCQQRIKCFATDIDKDALQRARYGIYSQQDVEELPLELLKKYFQSTESGYAFYPDLKQCIVFGHHNLAQHAPMSNIDLLICRNVLMYFNADIQKSILNRLHFGLQEAGFLVLGRAEAIISDQPTFKAIDWKQRIYTKGEPLTLPDVLTIMPKSF